MSAEEINMSKVHTYLLIIGVTAFVSTGTTLASQGNPGIAPINSHIATVKTYADLGAEWWQWAVQAPAADSPILDATGDKCRVGQQGPVWFLASTLGFGDLNIPTVRQCEVPGGKAIFFPVINNAYFAFLNDAPDTRTAEFVRTMAESSCDSNSIRNLSVAIDGAPVAKLAKFVTTAEQSPLFQAQLPTDNIFALDSSVAEKLMLSPAAHKGFYLYIAPLPAGSHTIKWKATWDCDFGGGLEEQSENVMYKLNILKGVSGQE
jgi:hypothetical protein